MNKKAQVEVSIWVWLAVIIGLLITAPIILKLVTEPTSKFVDATASIDGNASAQGGKVLTKFTNFWDTLIVIAFLVFSILLLVSSFLVDTHPVFMFLYVVFAFLLILFTPFMADALDKIYGMPQFSTAVNDIPFSDFLRTNIEGITLGIVILSGVVIYAKFRFLSNGF